jgi:hypothetical protein
MKKFVFLNRPCSIVRIVKSRQGTQGIQKILTRKPLGKCAVGRMGIRWWKTIR